MAFMDYLQDPLAWLSVLGTGLGIYGQMGQGRQQARANVGAQQQYENVYNANQAAMQAYQNQLAGYYGLYNEMAGQARASQEAARGQMQSLMGSPIDVDAFYRPLSEVARKAALQGPMANIAARGIQPGGYYDSIASEVLARLESGNWTTAAQLAAQHRNAQLSALGGLGVPGFIPPAQPAGPALMGYPPLPPGAGAVPGMNFGQAVAPIGQYLQYRANRASQQAIQDAILTGRQPRTATPEPRPTPSWYSPWGVPPSAWSLGPSLYPGGDLDYTPDYF